MKVLIENRSPHREGNVPVAERKKTFASEGVRTFLQNVASAALVSGAALTGMALSVRAECGDIPLYQLRGVTLPGDFNVRDYGAVGDGVRAEGSDSRALQSRERREGRLSLGGQLWRFPSGVLSLWRRIRRTRAGLCVRRRADVHRGFSEFKAFSCRQSLVYSDGDACKSRSFATLYLSRPPLADQDARIRHDCDVWLRQ